jgi:SAM-dependent methyltransferase
MAMSVERTVEDHYSHGTLIATIEAALAASGIDPDAVTVADLAPVDEFHIGGRAATVDLAGKLALAPSDRALDVGSGLGGASRFFADEFGCAVTGIDLTAEYVATARTLSERVGLGERNTFEHASALAMPFGDASFDAAYMLHVGMNIAAKTELFTETARVLVPGGRLGIYDVMRTGDGEIVYPVPWAETGETSFVASPEDYRAALESASLDLQEEQNRRDWALEFFRTLRAKAAGADGPPPLGIHILMGERAGKKVANMLRCVTAGIIAPVQIIARKPG